MGKKSRGKKIKANKLSNSQLEDFARDAVLGESTSVIMNGLSTALGLDENQTPQLSSSDSLFKNLRFYLVSNMRQMISQAYVELGLVQTVVDVPVEDGLKGELEIRTKQLDEEELQELKSYMEEKGDLVKAGQALKWTRLYGGGGIVIMTGQDPSTPLDISTLVDEGDIEFRAVDMWELYHDKQNTDDYSAAISPDSVDTTEVFDYYGIKLHKSRVLILKGKEVPSFIRPRMRGWGVSVVESLVRSINQYLKTNNLTYEVLDEFKLDIFKIKGLTSALHTPEGHRVIEKRVALANKQKNYQNALTMDSEDDYMQKQLSFAGIGDTMAGIRMQVASDVRMPLTKLFGISAAGFSSGEDDIENYNSSIEASIRTPAKPVITKIIKIRCAELFGFIPDDLTFEFESLRMLSTEQEENVKTQSFNRVLQARQAGELSRVEFREAINKDNLLPMQLEVTSLGDESAVIPDAIEHGIKGVSKGYIQTTATKPPSSPMPKNSYENDPHNFKGDRVAVVGILSGDEILVGRRWDNGLWVSPAGHIEDGEDNKEGAVREVFEESGIRLLTSDLKEVRAEIITGKDGKKFALFVYFAKIAKQQATSENDPDKEVGKWKWIKRDLGKKELKFENRHAKYDDAIIKCLLEGNVPL